MLSLWIASSLTSKNIDSAPLAIVPMFIHYWVGFRASQENWMEFGMKPREQGERRGGTWNVLQYDASRMALFAALFGNLFQHFARIGAALFRRGGEQKGGLGAVFRDAIATAGKGPQRHPGPNIAFFYPRPPQIHSFG